VITSRFRWIVFATIAMWASSVMAQIEDLKRLATLPLDPHDLSRHSFQVAWIAETGVYHVVSASLAKNTLYVETDEAALHAIDISTGEMRWKAYLRAELDYPPGKTRNRTVLFSHDQIIVFHDGSGRRLSHRHIPYGPAVAPVGRDNLVFYADQAGFIRGFCLDMMKPCFAFKTARRITGPLAYTGGRVYVGSGDKKIYCLDESLHMLWSFETGGAVDSGIFVRGNTVYAGSSDTFAYALDAKTGRPRSGWPFSTGSEVVDIPYALGGLVFVPSFENGVYGVDAKTGKERWYAKEAVRFLALGKRDAYLKAPGPNVLAVDPTTGEIEWKWLLGGFQRFLSNPTTSDLILVSDKGLVVALREK